MQMLNGGKPECKWPVVFAFEPVVAYPAKRAVQRAFRSFSILQIKPIEIIMIKVYLVLLLGERVVELTLASW